MFWMVDIIRRVHWFEINSLVLERIVIKPCFRYMDELACATMHYTSPLVALEAL